MVPQIPLKDHFPTSVAVRGRENTHPLIYCTGMANPVYITSNIRIIELGARACAMVFVIEAKRRKNMLIDSVIVKATRRKKKKGPGSRRKFAMKYRVELTMSEFVIL